MRLVTDPLLTIGAFARAVGLSASALRYYDECGLLTPAEVDDTTGYRYYTPALSQQARLVAQLRELGVPIHVMKQVVTGSPEQGRAVLRDLVNAQQATTERVSSIVGQVQAELGSRLLRRYWRKGLASEGARELVRHGFEDLVLTRIFAETMTVNAASRATMTAVGLQHVRTFHTHWDEPISGSELGEVEYAISREQWLAR